MTDRELGSVGRYRLVRRLGRGGMAEVFEARASGAAGVVKDVCVKRILPTYVRDHRFVRMFIDEARVSMALHHGNVAQVFDFGQDGEELFLAMELVDGQSLHGVHRKLGRRGYRFPLALALRIAQETLEGLHHAHLCADSDGRILGIVHRDISPQNVLLSYEGQVKLVDFGIARAVEVVEFGRGPKGKLPYMAPEQASRSDQVDARADVFGVGALLLELLTGRTPVQGADAAALEAVLAGRIPLVLEVAPWMDPELAAILDRALDPDRESRWPSALAFRQALAGYMHHRELRTSEDDLGDLVRWLFHEELSREGRSVSQRSAWETRLEPAEAPAPGPGGRTRQWATLAGSGALLAALVVGILVIASGPEARSVQVRSRPAGARVLMDGQDTGVTTDGTLAEVPQESVHQLSFRLEGHQSVELPLLPGQDVVAVLLERLAEEVVRPAPVEAPAVVPVSAVALEQVTDGDTVRVQPDPVSAFIPHRTIPASWFDLEPAKAHHLSSSGKVRVMSLRDSAKVAWVALDAGGEVLRSGLHPGVGETRLPRGTAQLGAFILEAGSCGNNAGSLELAIRGGRVPILASLDAVRHCLSLERTRLGPEVSLASEFFYRARYEGSGPRFMMVGRTMSVLALTREADEAVLTLGPGEAVDVRLVSYLRLVTFEPAGVDPRPLLLFKKAPR